MPDGRLLTLPPELLAATLASSLVLDLDREPLEDPVGDLESSCPASGTASTPGPRAAPGGWSCAGRPERCPRSILWRNCFLSSSKLEWLMMRMCSFMGIACFWGVFLVDTPFASASLYSIPGRPKYSQNSLKETTPSLFLSMSASSRPWASASGRSSPRSTPSSRGESAQTPRRSSAWNSCRSSSSNWSSSEDRHAATNSRYSQALSPLTSSAEATFFAMVLSMPSDSKAAITSARSRMPLLSVSNFEKILANLLIDVLPTAIFRHIARCMGLRWCQVSTASHTDLTSFCESWLSSATLNQRCLRASDAEGLAASLNVRSCLHRAKPSGLHCMSVHSGPLRWSSSHFSCCLDPALTPPLTLKGRLFAKSSNMTQPRLQTSLFGPQLPLHTSGAIVHGVPAILEPRCMPKMLRQHTSAMPRSQMTTCGGISNSPWPSSPDSLLSRRRFWPFKSLCTTPLECK
mmetsp:Transcript_91351/g.289601  ORF Transcript_91351/g.289601 Transcript_91351/m.289601 type:complete len:461 (-) Transcript_91351:302-1684(-)